MAQVEIALSMARDWASLHRYGWDAVGPQGMIVTWECPVAPFRRLICLGLDICGTRRWEQMLVRTPEVAARVFSQSEMKWANAQPERLARAWAIKEAVAKALGCGFAGLAYRDIAVEFASPSPAVRLPAPVPTDLPGEQELSDLRWQLILFGDPTLV